MYFCFQKCDLYNHYTRKLSWESTSEGLSNNQKQSLRIKFEILPRSTTGTQGEFEIFSSELFRPQLTSDAKRTTPPARLQHDVLVFFMSAIFPSRPSTTTWIAIDASIFH